MSQMNKCWVAQQKAVSSWTKRTIAMENNRSGTRETDSNWKRKLLAKSTFAFELGSLHEKDVCVCKCSEWKMRGKRRD